MDNICEKKDCKYYSMYTDTCDFTLINYRRRPCPVQNCTEYETREATRTWMRYFPVVSWRGGEEKVMSLVYPPVPSPPLEPPEDGFIIADCGHEVYDGERMYELPGGDMLCPDCVEDRFLDMTTYDKARLLGCEATVVRVAGGGR
jgi:hypothetical protein